MALPEGSPTGSWSWAAAKAAKRETMKVLANILTEDMRMCREDAN